MVWSTAGETVSVNTIEDSSPTVAELSFDASVVVVMLPGGGPLELGGGVVVVVVVGTVVGVVVCGVGGGVVVVVVAGAGGAVVVVVVGGGAVVVVVGRERSSLSSEPARARARWSSWSEPAPGRLDDDPGSVLATRRTEVLDRAR